MFVRNGFGVVHNCLKMCFAASTLISLLLLSLGGVYVQNQSANNNNNAYIELINSCKCVKHFLCDKNNNIITNGAPFVTLGRRINGPEENITIIPCQGGTFPNEIVCCKPNGDSNKISTLATTEKTTVTTTYRTTTISKPEPRAPNTDVKPNVDNKDDDSTCGVQKTIINTRIYTGVDDLNPTQGEFPWIAAIFKKTTSGRYKFLCSGSLIHPNVVLTITHCLHKKKTSDLRVVVNGKIKLSEQDAAPEEKRDVSEVVNHPGYNDKYLFNDVSLIILEKPYLVETWSQINTLCLPPSDFNLEGTKCLVTGWGIDKSQQRSRTLKKVELPFVNHTHCQTLLRRTKLGRSFNLDTSFMCAGGEKGRDACLGDGGSPLMCAKYLGSTQYFIAGMVSWGVDCASENIPGVYTEDRKSVV